MRNGSINGNIHNTKNAEVDVRYLLLTMTSLMVLAFGIGVGSDPTTASSWVLSRLQSAWNGMIDVDAVDGMKDPMVVRSFQQNETSGTWFENQQQSGSDVQAQDDIPYKKRLPEAHILDLGELVDPEQDGEEHQPAGQHLLVDLRNVEYDFLASEDRLSQAMVDVVQESKLTLLSYHCHSLQPTGVSCVGVLLESHISFHTWPEEGVITLDLFTCGINPLIPVIPSIERLFGIPKSDEEEVICRWSHELRGFRNNNDRMKHHLDNASDLSTWVTSTIQTTFKKEIVSIQTPFQQIDIWDILEPLDTPSYKDVLKAGLEKGDPRLLTSEISTPNRLLFLDGSIQSTSDEEAELHEALVHPAMFTHANPRSVAILGGGEGATIREVLKHKTVKSVKMIEIDKMVVDIAKEHLKTFNSCAHIVGSTDSCFEDPRASIIYSDVMEYILKNKSDVSFDVVIIDGLDPEDMVGQPKDMYLNEEFIKGIFDTLTDDGVVVVQVGTSPTIHDPAPHRGVYKRRERLFNLMEEQAEAIFVYEESHCGFNEPASFLVACKSSSCRQRWYASVNAIDFQIFARVPNTKNGEAALVHYDGATHSQYRFAPKAWETLYCRREPMPFECNYRGLDLSKNLYEYDTNPDLSDFTIKEDEDGQVGVFANVFIDKGSYILSSDLASSFTITDTTIDILLNSTSRAKEQISTPTFVIDDMLSYVKEHGHQSMIDGIDENIVEIGTSSLIREIDDLEMVNVGRMMEMPKEGIPPYSPVFERRRRSFDVFLVATKAIQANEELLKYTKLWNNKYR